MSTLGKTEVSKLDLPYDAIADFYRRWEIIRLEVLGAALREDFGPDSDWEFFYTFAA